MRATSRVALFPLVVVFSVGLDGGCPLFNGGETTFEVVTLPIDDGLEAEPVVAGNGLTTFETDLFAGSGLCATCHTDLVDAGGNEVPIATHWRSTMMAAAARDPLFLATVEDEIAHFPALQEVIEGTCATCHTPMARTQATTDETPVTLFDGGFTDPTNELHEAAEDGVACTVCHQIQNVNLGNPESFSGGYTIDTGTAKPDRVTFGPYPDQSQDLMRTVAGFTPEQGSHIEEAALCATCHTLFTPTVNEAGEVVGTFPEQMAFFEWQASDYSQGGEQGRTCQQCHMPEADGEVIISSLPGNSPAREPFSRHHFVGGNTFMLKLLRANVDDLDLTASSDDYLGSLERMFLQFRSFIGLSVIDATCTDDTLTLQVRVENNAGHKFPTGFPSRRAWIHLVVTDAGGEVVFESGAPQADGSIAGNDADADAATIEPHFDTITSGDQVQIYESILADTDAEPTYFLLRAAGYVKDNRLLPPGFDKAAADDDIAVRGQAAGDADFVGGSDEVTYEIPLSGRSARYTAVVRLCFQSVSYRYAEEVLQSGGPRVQQFAALRDEADQAPAVITALEVTIQ